MLFFRSEERVREWCAGHGYPMRPLVTMDQLWTLATTWYSTRLEENSRRPQPDEMRSIFAGLGLGATFGIRSRIVSVNRFVSKVKLARCPHSLAAFFAGLPSMLLMPFAPF